MASSYTRSEVEELRRIARRKGLKLLKSRQRDPGEKDYGLFALINLRTGFAGLGYSRTLDEVRAHLGRYESSCTSS